MDLLHFRYFMVVAKFQHMTKAAQSLHIAQPALSQIIKQLENELGVTLFDRKSRGIFLNDSGKLLQHKLEPILKEIDTLPELLKEQKDEADHMIHLNLMAASSIITNFIISYKALHPNVKFHLYQDQDQLHDLSITTIDYQDKIPAHSKVLLSEDFFLAVPFSSSLSKYNSISLIDTKYEEFISLGSFRPLRAICDNFCNRAGFTPNIVFESNDPESVRNLIAAGIGIGFWPEFSWGELHTSQVKRLTISEPVCKRHVLMTLSPSGRKKQIIQDFSQFLQDQFSKLIL